MQRIDAEPTALKPHGSGFEQQAATEEGMHSMSWSNDGDDDPEKPNRPEPPNTRFKPGVSGNPKGRPKGSVGMKAKLQRELLKKTTVKTVGGKSARMAKGDVIVTQLVEKAMRDPKVAVLVWRWVADDSSDAPSTAGAAGAGRAIPSLDRETLRRILNRARRLEEDEPDEQ